jgi:hypothetical protein
MRPNPTHIGRALADRLHRGRAIVGTSTDPARADRRADALRVPASRTARLRRMLGAARVTPYQLRRGWLW